MNLALSSNLFPTETITIKDDLIAIISDVHANLPALETVLDDIASHGVTTIISLGDNFGYYPWVKKTYDLFKNKHVLSILGNHDFGLIETNSILVQSFTSTAKYMLEWSKPQVTPKLHQWILDLPLRLKIKTSHDNITLIHGHPNRPFEYFYSYSEQTLYDMIRESLEKLSATGLCVGHTHIPIFYKLESSSKFFLNPGSVGQPRDKNPKASYALFNTDTRTAEIIRLTYDIKRVEEEMKDLDLPHELYERLYLGR